MDNWITEYPDWIAHDVLKTFTKMQMGAGYWSRIGGLVLFAAEVSPIHRNQLHERDTNRLVYRPMHPDSSMDNLWKEMLVLDEVTLEHLIQQHERIEACLMELFL